MDAFIPIYESALIITDLITVILLFSQFCILRSTALWVLACGYLFSALMTVAHMLTFPGLFAPSGLLGAGRQSTAWLYAFWHGGFPLFLIAYVQLKKAAPNSWQWRCSPSVAILAGIAMVAVMVTGFTYLVTGAQVNIPAILLNNHYTPIGSVILTSTWVLSVLALIILWRQRPHTILDLWLTVVMCAWIFDIALAAVLNAGRFDLGFYAGRIYGLLATSFVLLLLLLEYSRLYFQLAGAHERERNKALDLERLNAQIKESIEERTSALEALHAKEEEQQAILENLYDCVITIDSNGTVRSANPALERILGYTTTELIGNNVSMIMPEPQHSEHNQYLENYKQTNVPRVIGIGREIAGQHKTGRLVELELSISEYRVSGQRFFAGILRDIGERKRFIDELTQAMARAKQANRAKDSFLATISHEIRTPLTGMLGMLELLSMTPLERGQYETLNVAWNSARGLLRILNDILDWSKIEAGKLELSLQASSVPQLLQEVVNTYSRVASAKRLVLSQHADPRLSRSHIVDPLRLSQILNNFVSNAIKFTRQGSIEIRAELLEQIGNRERIRFSVHDTGIGISREDQIKLFQSYQQGGADTARLYGGTGLGLAICRRLAEAMGGEVGLSSEPGQGSIFSLTLSLEASDEPGVVIHELHPELEQRVVQPLIHHRAETPLILIADDHPINRDLLANQINILGLKAETAENGRVALSMWETGRFALIITDCHMPQMDGYTFAMAVREQESNHGLARTPIIAWTANALPEEAARCLSVGIDELLVKPTRLAELKAMLQKYLSEQGVPSSATATEQASERADNGPIDPQILQQIFPDRLSQVRLLNDFHKHIQIDYTQLIQSLEQGDMSQLEHTAHRMKGSCRMVGAVEMSTVCAAIELAANRHDYRACEENKAAMNDVMAKLDQYFSEIDIS
ncbi:ATP-binding protein [Chitinibacter sp. S2-10]|uniref:ATP-binding protein n=1 Tax=Chitinibacter sp. S2-10 TaxID=3373597 RepID=UPI003977CB44